MRKSVILAGAVASALTAAAAFAQTAAPQAGSGPTAGQERPDGRPEGRHGRFGRMMSPEDRAAYADARIAGLKALLRLTPEQEKHWPAFEAALREASTLRGQRMAERQQRFREMRENREAARPDPVQRLRAAADRMAQNAAITRKIADAAGPLYSSLDEAQKRRAERLILRAGWAGGHPGMMMGRHGHMGEGMGGGWGRHEGGRRGGPGGSGGEGGRL